MEKVNEISTIRLLNHFTDGKTLAIVSTFRNERPESENMRLLSEFKTDIRNRMKLGFTELVSRWVEQQDGQNVSSDERSLMVYGISLDDAMAYGQKYQQSSIIFKDTGKCAEVCTTAFTDWEGKSYSPGGIVRTFDVSGSSHPFNVDDARDIFEKRKGGPASMPVKSNRPFKLVELLEVEGPKAAMFSEKEKFIKIF